MSDQARPPAAQVAQATKAAAVKAASESAQSENYWYELIDTTEAAAFLGIAKRTMEYWRGIGGGPPYSRLGRCCVRYRRADLDDWARAREHTSTAEETLA